MRIHREDWILLTGPFNLRKELQAGEVALYHPDFFSGPEARYWSPKAVYRLKTPQIQDLCAEFSASVRDRVPSIAFTDASLQDFSTSFTEIQQRFAEPGLKKAVPIVFENSPQVPTPAMKVQMLKALTQAPQNLYVFGSWDAQQGVLGATPEVLLQKQGTCLTTMALAGTCPKEDCQLRNSLLEDPKERLEHQLVVEDLSQVLKEYGNVCSQGPMILELPTLFHLKTDLECQIESGNFDFFAACQALHPTPALGVSPRSYGYQWMAELPQQKQRGGFGAPWGLQWSAEEALCLVAIRNLQWDAQGSRIGSGCGVVPASDLKQEWRELSQKRMSVKKVLGLLS